MGGYIGARAGTLSTTVANVQDVTATDTTPEVTIVNTTHEDTDGGREGKVIFKGQQSGGEESTLAEIQASHDGTADDEKGELILRVNDGNDGASPSEAMRINSLGNVGIGTASVDVSTQAGGSGYKALQIESDEGGQLNFDHNDAGTGSTLGQINFQRAGEVVAEIEGVTDGATDNGRIAFRVQPDGGALTEAMRITHEGNVQIGTTTDRPDNYNGSGSGIEFAGLGLLRIARNGDVAVFNRVSTNGDIVSFTRDGTTIGQIGGSTAVLTIVGKDGNAGIGVQANQYGKLIYPIVNVSANTLDDGMDIGYTGGRFDDIYATNGTIQTSDEREKQNITSLTSAEITAATAISKLFKTFKWKSKVSEKGDNARTHTGVVAQQVQTAMSDAGLDAGNYAFFINGKYWKAEETYTDDDGVEQTQTNVYQAQEEAPEGATEHTRMGIRYPELLAFIGAATEQRLTSIESRLTALEAE